MFASSNLRIALSLLWLLWLGACPLAATAQSNQVYGETQVCAGTAYTYYASVTCDGTVQYNWSVQGGAFAPGSSPSDDSPSVIWDNSGGAKYIGVSVNGYSTGGTGFPMPTICDPVNGLGVQVVTPTAGSITGPNAVCPSTSFTLNYSNSLGVDYVDWYEQVNGSWEYRTSSWDKASAFSYSPTGITQNTAFRAVPTGCSSFPEAFRTVSVLSVSSALAGRVLGERDASPLSNAGVVTLADYNGQIAGWQFSEDEGTTWRDLPDTSEELPYQDLTTTTWFRAKVNNCSSVQYSQACAIRMSGMNWQQTTVYDEGGNVAGDSRSYFDQLGRPLQSQARNISSNKVLATQNLFGQFDQPVGSTLNAPMNSTEFNYDPLFFSPSTEPSKSYSYQHFDAAGTVNAPVGASNATVGKLGWYYSTNNTLEPLTATTAYPYSRTQGAADGSTGVVRSTQPGDAFRLGEHRETASGTFPVRSELDNYLSLRNRYFSTAELGATLSSLSTIATQKLGMDAHGEKVVSLQDKEGHTLMTASPGQTGDWLTVNNSVEIGWPYMWQKAANEIYETPVVYAPSDIMVYNASGVRVYVGPPQNFSMPNPVSAAYSFFCQDAFKIVTGRILDASTNQPISWNSAYELPASERQAYAYYNFYTFAAGAVSVSPLMADTDYQLINSVDQSDVTSAFKSNPGSLSAGLYQIRLLKGRLTLNYTNSYKDISYSFYNQKGLLVGSIAPNGVKQVLTSTSPTESGLRAWLRLDESTGLTATDSSPVGSHGQLSGGVWQPAGGVYGGALELSGSSYVSLPLGWQPNAFTISWWTKPTQRYEWNQMVKVNNGWGDFLCHTDSYGRVYAGTDINTYLSTAPEVLELNKWQQFTFTYSAGSAKLYKNGQLVASGSGLSAPGGWTTLSVGTFYPWDGLLDDLRVYDRALTDSDVAQLNRSRIPFATQYEYDTQGRLIAQTETDAGRTEYFYRTDGKLRFSQDTRQRASGYFSYTSYDNIGRTIEVGECRPSSASYFASIRSDAAVLDYVPTTGEIGDAGLGNQQRNDVVRTTYDKARNDYTFPSGYTPEFLAGRVASTVRYMAVIPNSYAAEISRTMYSYDEQGRTKWLIKHNIGLPARTIDYTYDIAGNVLTVCYQKDVPAERLTHYYTYDADKRLSKVETGTDAPNPFTPHTEQARYSYYLNGPLKRIVYGGDLQGVDYTYTAQGWLKGINNGDLVQDPGADGSSASTRADFFGLSLHYYPNDYASRNLSPSTSLPTGTFSPRYDGNLYASNWQTPGSPQHAFAYQYDKRNQLLTAEYGRMTAVGTQYSYTSQGGRYSESNLDYDPNGNMRRMRRTDGVGWASMDVNYNYQPNTNKLQSVQTVGGNTPVISFNYDAVGQLTAQEETAGNKYFTYDATGKVTYIYRDAAKTQPLAAYLYDEFGQRIYQLVYTNPADLSFYTVTYYVRDGSGNELATYVYSSQSGQTQLYEQPIYGATRLGTFRRQRENEPMEQLYELNDQLGNTRVIFRRPLMSTYKLTMEDNRVMQEVDEFPNPDDTNNTPVGTTYNQVRTSYRARRGSPYGSNYSMVLANRRGPGKTLLVDRGDKIHLEVYGAYPNTNGDIFGRVAPFVGAAGAAAALSEIKPRTETTTPGVNKWQRVLSKLSLGIAIPLASKIPGGGGGGNPAGLPPAARLYYVLTDNNNNYITSGSRFISTAAEASWELLSLDITIDKPGKLQVYTESLDATPVYFDDLEIDHTPGPVVQEQHFYAYGQPLTGDPAQEFMSWRRNDHRRYRHGYQGLYADADEETRYDSFELRLYDSRIGRWTSMDPYGQYHSPYMGMGNNPVNGVDPDGGWLFGWFGSTAAERRTDRALNLVNSAPNGSLVYDDKGLIGVSWSQNGQAYARSDFRSPYSGVVNRDVALFNGTWDPTTDAQIQSMRPFMQQDAIDFINDVEEFEGVKLRVTFAYRDIQEQNRLYAQGRTTPGKIVTYARGGLSPHNYGLAIDVVPIVNGKADWNVETLKRISPIGKKYGFNWGGDWKGKKRDPPHFEQYFRHGRPTVQLLPQ